MSNEVENLKLSAGAAKAPVGIVPMHSAYGKARVLEDSACKYAPFNYMAQTLADALESYDSAWLRHRIACTKLGGQVTPESYAALDEDSGIPHIFHMLTGLEIIVSLMIRDGVLPLDPGQGKRKLARDMSPKARLDALEKQLNEALPSMLGRHSLGDTKYTIEDIETPRQCTPYVEPEEAGEPALCCACHQAPGATAHWRPVWDGGHEYVDPRQDGAKEEVAALDKEIEDGFAKSNLPRGGGAGGVNL